MNITKSDVDFIRNTLLPWASIKAIYLKWNNSTKKWPDIWIEKSFMPIITVTAEWRRQNIDERRKRLVHEFLHLKGLEHNESIGYSAFPNRDSYSIKIYRGLLK